jgi:hypothetical protein
MSLWTPDGERPVGRPAPTPEPTVPTFDDLTPDERAEAEALAAEMAEVRQQVAATPAAVIVANHVMGLYELAAIHLSQEPPNFAEAAVGIDAMAAVLDKLEGRLGENEPVLRDARAQLQLAFVELKRRVDAGE